MFQVWNICSAGYMTSTEIVERLGRWIEQAQAARRSATPEDARFIERWEATLDSSRKLIGIREAAMLQDPGAYSGAREDPLNLAGMVSPPVLARRC